MKTTNNNVIKLIKDGIKDLDITRTAVAGHLGISQQQFNNILNGGATVPVKYFQKIADFLLIDEETLRQEFIADYANSLEDAIKAGSKR